MAAEPFSLEVSGKAVIPILAERALINVHVASSGSDKATVTDDVVTAAKNIENLLREHSAKDDSAEAKEAAALAHWSKTSLSATSHVPYDHNTARDLPRVFNAKIDFDIRFKEFKALGSFGSKISALPHVEVQDIDWILTTATAEAHYSKLRRQAAQDALTKAQDYCEVLGCTNLRPSSLEEGESSTRSVAKPSSLFGSSRRAMQISSFQATRPMTAAEPTYQLESDLEFTPQEVRMEMTISIKFHADPIAGKAQPTKHIDLES